MKGTLRSQIYETKEAAPLSTLEMASTDNPADDRDALDILEAENKEATKDTEIDRIH